MDGVEDGSIEKNQIFNVGGHQMENNEMMAFLMAALGKPPNAVTIDNSQDRPGHDLAYNLNSNKLDNLVGEYTFERFVKEIKDTVSFYTEKHPNRTIDEYYENFR